MSSQTGPVDRPEVTTWLSEEIDPVVLANGEPLAATRTKPRPPRPLQRTPGPSPLFLVLAGLVFLSVGLGFIVGAAIGGDGDEAPSTANGRIDAEAPASGPSEDRTDDGAGDAEDTQLPAIDPTGTAGDGSEDTDQDDETEGGPSSDDDDEGSAMEFESEEKDDLGRAIPTLPDTLVPNTPDPSALANYPPDPVTAPSDGPYTVVDDGTFFLRGTVSSENLRQELIRRNLLVKDLDALVIEYEVEESDPWFIDEPTPIFFDNSLLFASGSAVFGTETLQAWQPFVELMMIDSRVTLDIIGHTDSNGPAEINLAVSTARVDAVSDAFVLLGAPADQITTEAKGEDEPVASNQTAAGRAANRRVEFLLTIEAGAVDG